MNSTNLGAHSSPRECWLPILQLATQEVFELMLGSSLEVLSGTSLEPGLDVTALVGLAGELCGILTLRTSEKAAVRMACLMLGIDRKESDPQAWDAIGEICNMVAGNFKSKISGLGDGCVLSVPTVITGSGYCLHSMISEEVQAAFLFEGGLIVLALEIYN